MSIIWLLVLKGFSFFVFLRGGCGDDGQRRKENLTLLSLLISCSLFQMNQCLVRTDFL